MNLGSLLKDRFHVLVLDIDITGTSISAIQKSRFWKSETYLLSYHSGDIINLLQYFTRSFLTGEKRLEFTTSGDDRKVLVKDGAVNVIASELYGDDADMLYDPSLLLENLHVYWLTKMIIQICESFSACFSDRKSVIILDNSPGFVGLGKAVHGILTDIGPNRAKFLTVSSLDIQDIESCVKSAYIIHNEYKNKLYGAHYPETQRGDEDFYAQVQLSGTTEYEYYKINETEAPVSLYQGIIVNKVAKGIVDGRRPYDFDRYQTTPLSSFYSLLFSDGVKGYLVPFDSVLLTQFYGVYGEEQIPHKKNQSILKQRIATIEGQIRLLEESSPESLPYDLLRRANGLDRTIDTLKGALIACGYEIIAAKFNSDWSPVSPLRSLIDVLKKLGVTSESFELYVPKRERMKKEIQLYKEITAYSSISNEKFFALEWFVSAVASVACELSFCYSNASARNVRREGDDSWENERKKWAKRVSNSLLLWMNNIIELYDSSSGDIKLPAFILSYHASSSDYLLKTIHGSDEFVWLTKESISRLMDVPSDMRTLLNTIRSITVNNDGRFSLDVDFVQFLDDKIITKRYDYNQAKAIMSNVLRDSDYMAAFKEVLNRIIINWGI